MLKDLSKVGEIARDTLVEVATEEDKSAIEGSFGGVRIVSI